MPSFKLSGKAKADLKSIALYPECELGRDQRNRYVLQFDQCFHLLSDNPNLGQVCDAISPGYRQYPHGCHIIFYRLATENNLEIIRILHKRMLPEGHLL